MRNNKFLFSNSLLCVYVFKLWPPLRGFKVAYNDPYISIRWHHSYQIAESLSKPWSFNLDADTVQYHKTVSCRVFLLCHDCARLIFASLFLDISFLQCFFFFFGPFLVSSVLYLCCIMKNLADLCPSSREITSKSLELPRWGGKGAEDWV